MTIGKETLGIVVKFGRKAIGSELTKVFMILMIIETKRLAVIFVRAYEGFAAIAWERSKYYFSKGSFEVHFGRILFGGFTLLKNQGLFLWRDYFIEDIKFHSLVYDNRYLPHRLERID